METCVEEEDDNRHHRVQDESHPVCGRHLPSIAMGHDGRHSGQQRPKGTGENRTEVVDGEDAWSVRRVDQSRDIGLLGRQKHAHVPCGRVERPEHGDHHQRPEPHRGRKANASQHHHDGGGEESRLEADTVTSQPEQQGHARRTQKRPGDDGPDGDRAEAEVAQVLGEQDADEAISKPPQRPPGDDPGRVRGRRRWQDLQRDLNEPGDVRGGSRPLAARAARRPRRQRPPGDPR